MILTFLSMIVDKETTYSYKQLYTVASPYIWYQKMRHIGPLQLYKLGKKYFEIWLQGKKISQYPHYALLKISQHILRKPPANKAICLFY